MGYGLVTLRHALSIDGLSFTEDPGTIGHMNDQEFAEGFELTLDEDLTVYSDMVMTQAAGTIPAGTEVTITSGMESYTEIRTVDVMHYYVEGRGVSGWTDNERMNIAKKNFYLAG